MQRVKGKPQTKRRTQGTPSSVPPSQITRLPLPRGSLEMDAKTEFHLPRAVRLILDHAPLAGMAAARILIQAGGRVRRLEMIEDVSNQGVESEPHTLIDLGLFVNGEVQIPARKAANAACATKVRVHAKHRPAKVAVHRLRLGIGIQPSRVAAT